MCSDGKMKNHLEVLDTQEQKKSRDQKKKQKIIDMKGKAFL